MNIIKIVLKKTLPDGMMGGLSSSSYRSRSQARKKEEGCRVRLATCPTENTRKAHRRKYIASDAGQISRTTTNARTRKRIWKRKNQPLRIACWNVRSFNNKEHEILMELNENKIDICAISETKKKGAGTNQCQNYIHIYSGKEKSARAASGVGLLVHEKFKNNIDNIEYISDRILKTTMRFDNKPLHIISIYAPDTGRPDHEAVEWFDEIQNEISKINHLERLVILGDFNARIGNNIINGVKQRYNEETINERGEMLIELCIYNELRINNTFYPHKTQQKNTFMGNRNNTTTIDFVITNRSITPNQVLDVRSLTSANIGSDHHLVLCKLRINAHPVKKQLPLKRSKFNIESLEQESVKQLYHSRLDRHIIHNKMTDEDEVEEGWIKVKTNIQDAAREAIGVRTINTDQKLYKPWFTEELKTITSEKRKAYLRFRSCPSQEERDKYNRIRNQTNIRVREIKREYWERFSSDMTHDLYGAQKRVWKMLRSMKRETSEYVQLGTINEQTWITYFEELYDENDNDQGVGYNFDTEEISDEVSVSITDGQLQEAIKTLKNRKSPGEDDIHNELIKYGGDLLITELSKLFHKILENGTLPSDWKKSITIPIYKKGNKKDPSNYRGITLLSSVMKLFTKIVAENLQHLIEVNEEQQGFRKNRSTIDAIFILRQIVEKSLEYDTPAYICFVDLSKAFDRIRLQDVIKILEKKKIPTTYRKIIQDLNTNNTTKIRTRGKVTTEIKVTTGIRQGDSLSPLLFNIVMNEIIDAVKESAEGYQLGNNLIKIICYADDAILVSNSEDSLQRLLFTFKRKGEELNMQISAEKTKSMTVSKQPLRCKLAIDNYSVEQVMTFNYLGINISSYGNLSEEVRQQTHKAARISGILNSTIWRNKHIPTDCKTRIYKTCVRPVMTYAGETRADTAITKRLLRTTEMRALRAIAGYTRRDQVRNTRIREICEVQDVVRWTRQRRRGWNEHVSRMDDQRLAKIARDNRPAGKRPPGRPHKRWRESWSSMSQEGKPPNPGTPQQNKP